MSRSKRIEFEGAWYYVYCQAHEGQELFGDGQDYNDFLGLLNDACRMFSIEVHAYSLLKDEYHLIVHTPKAELSRAMRHVNGIYTQNYNKRWDSSGSVFASRYRSLVFDPKQYLKDMVTYVHTRPVSLGEAKKASDHKWTSHKYYLKEKEKPACLSTQAVYKNFGFIKTIANVRFNAMVNRGVSKSFLTECENERVVLGDSVFKKMVNDKQARLDKKTNETVVNQKQRVGVAKDILDFVAKSYEMPVNQLKSSQAGVANEARSMAVYQLRLVAGLSQKEIAKHLGSKNPYTMAKVLERFNAKLNQEGVLKKKAEKISDEINKRL